MIWFGYVYLDARMVIIDVCIEHYQGQRWCVASLSEDTRVCCYARRAEDAIQSLVARLRGMHQPSLHVTFAPELAEPIFA